MQIQKVPMKWQQIIPSALCPSASHFPISFSASHEQLTVGPIPGETGHLKVFQKLALERKSFCDIPK